MNLNGQLIITDKLRLDPYKLCEAIEEAGFPGSMQVLLPPSRAQALNLIQQLIKQACKDNNIVASWFRDQATGDTILAWAPITTKAKDAANKQAKVTCPPNVGPFAWPYT